MKNLKPSVCIDAVFETASLEIDQALSIVSSCGYKAFEFWCWWEKNLDELIAGRNKHDLKIAACCTKFISLVDPNLRAEYLDGLNESIATAKKLDCPILISQVGDFIPALTRDEQHQSLVEGLKAAAPLLEAADVMLVIEPLNEKVDHPGYYLV